MVHCTPPPSVLSLSRACALSLSLSLSLFPSICLSLSRALSHSSLSVSLSLSLCVCVSLSVSLFVFLSLFLGCPAPMCITYTYQACRRVASSTATHVTGLTHHHPVAPQGMVWHAGLTLHYFRIILLYFFKNIQHHPSAKQKHLSP